ncbi:unnamed protein product [Nesidiocoris tenuis]|nr:unnamed protein product [Nesidiocoris tenuis]
MLNIFRLKRLVLLCSSLTVVLFLVMYCAVDENFDLGWLLQSHISPEAHMIKCYDNESLSTIDDAAIQRGQTIFFLETSCHNRTFVLNPRQACAVESAAKLNPNLEVYVLVPSPFESLSSLPHMAALRKYRNIKIHHINMNTYFDNTPLEDWYKDGRLKSSRWPQSHASDVLRYATLWKYGGYYADLDVVMLKPFGDMINFVGAESDIDVAAGFLAFTHGHPLVHLAVVDLKQNYKGWDWGNNGPGVITRALKRYCMVREVTKMTKERCKGVDVMPPSAFYAIPWRKWKDYFATRRSDVDRVMATVNSSVAIHVWNYLSRNQSAVVGSNQPYVLLASRFCPEVYSTRHKFF